MQVAGVVVAAHVPLQIPRGVHLHAVQCWATVYCILPSHNALGGRSMTARSGRFKAMVCEAVDNHHMVCSEREQLQDNVHARSAARAQHRKRRRCGRPSTARATAPQAAHISSSSKPGQASSSVPARANLSVAIFSARPELGRIT